jgi:NifU-like protein involved in Fe-S cluster formation
MDAKVIQFYRKITREGYQFSGTINNPSIFLDSSGEKIPLCSKSVDSYINIYIKIKDDILEEVKYRHVGRPMSNVVAEIFCALLNGITIEKAVGLTARDFSDYLGTDDEEYLEASNSMIILLHIGLDRFKSKNQPPTHTNSRRQKH